MEITQICSCRNTQKGHICWEVESSRHLAHRYFEDAIERAMASHQGTFIDQNGLVVQDGAIYGIDELEDSYNPGLLASEPDIYGYED